MRVIADIPVIAKEEIVVCRNGDWSEGVGHRFLEIRLVNRLIITVQGTVLNLNFISRQPNQPFHISFMLISGYRG